MSASLPGSGGSRWARLAPAAAFAALVVLLYADPLVTGRNYGGKDMIAYNVPLEKSVHDAWARGRLPVWTPEVSGGRPLAPNPNAGALYPVRALFSKLPLPVALRLFPVAHWIAAGIGMLVLATALGRSRAAAWIGAVTYVFSGVAVGEAFFPHIQPGMTLLPWIVWAAGRRTGTRWSRLLLLSVLLALDFLAGDIFTIALAIACAALWLAVEEDRRAQLRAAGILGLAVILGALAAAPQIVATVLWIPQTNRAVLGMKLSDVLLFSIHPWRLLELAIPYPFGASWEMSAQTLWAVSIHRRAMGLFPTLYAGAFALVAVFVAWTSRVRGARFARILLIFALLVSVTPSLLPASWGSLSSPLPLRNPEKLAVAIAFALAIFAAIAFDAWRDKPRRLGGLIGVGALFAVLALAAALFPDAAGRLAVSTVGTDLAMAPVAARSLAFGLAEAGLYWMATVVALDALGRSRRRGGAILTAVILLTAVPIAANRKIAKTFGERDIFGPTAFARYVAKQDPEGAYRTLAESFFQGPSSLELEQNGAALTDSEFSRRAWYQYAPILWSRGMVFNEDFDVGDLSRVESLRKIAGMATGYRDSASFYGTVGLRFGIRYRDHEALAGYRPVGGDAMQIWDEHVRPFPDIRVLERWKEVPGSLDALQTLSSLTEGEVVIESGDTKAGAARPGSVRIVERSAERLVVDIESPDATWLFVLRAYWPYRTILLDGRPVEAQPAQLAFSAVPVPPGRHRLVWQERLPGLRIAVWGMALFGMIAAALVVAHGHRRNR